MREARRVAKRERREAERRAAAEEAAAALPMSPRNAAARVARREAAAGRASLRSGDWLGSDDLDGALGSSDDEGGGTAGGAPSRPGSSHGVTASQQVLLGAGGAPILDPLTARDSEDALCAVCGEGHSEAPNQIVFCERCDLAVHQVRRHNT